MSRCKAPEILRSIKPWAAPAECSPTQGAKYQFVDENVKNRRTYYYKLEDIDLNGTSTMHGPVTAEPQRVRNEDRYKGLRVKMRETTEHSS